MADYDGRVPCRHCEERIAWDGQFAVWRDEDGLVACFDGAPHQPAPLAPEMRALIRDVIRTMQQPDA